MSKVSLLKKIQLASLAAGLALMFYVIQRAGVGELLRHLGAMGWWGSLLILGISFVRNLARTGSWYISIDPAHRSVSCWSLLNVMLAGESIKYLTSTGPFLGEPAKAALVRRRLPLMLSISSLAVENITYYLSVVLFTLASLPALIWLLPMPSGIRWTGYAIAGVFVVVVLLVWLSIRRRSFALAKAVGYVTAARVQPQGDAAAKVKQFEERVYDFYEKRPGAFLTILALNLGAHLINIGEVCVILNFMALPASVFSGFIIEAATKLINLAFFFVPGRAGVYESGNALVLEGLGLGAGAGVALAIVRKLRAFFWAGWGLAALGVIGLRNGRDGNHQVAERIRSAGDQKL
jgi:uncharacterized membrane protein YbhN (UPF0104 family)